MTTPIDPFERRLPDVFTDLAAARTPDYLIDILGQTARTRQRPAWTQPGRWNPMNAIFGRAALAAAAFGLVVVVGGVLVLAGPGRTNPGSSPQPSASPTILDAGAVGKTLLAGTYRVASFEVPFTITMPATFAPRVVSSDNVSIDGTLAIQVIRNVIANPCHPEAVPSGAPAVSTVEGIVSGLTSLDGVTAGPVSDVMVGGHRGKGVQLTEHVDAWSGICSDLELHMWTLKSGIDYEVPDDHSLWVRVIDVDGTPVVIVTMDDFVNPSLGTNAQQASDTIVFD